MIMANAGGLQLLPQTRKKLELKIPGENKFLVLSLLFVLVIGGIYFALYSYRVSIFNQAIAVDDQVASLEKQRNKDTEKQLLSLNQQLSVVKPLISGHIMWSQALQRIQAMIAPTVQFSSLTTDLLKKSIVFKATADNYTTVAHQIAAFYRDPAISDVNLNKITNLTTGRVEFDMELSIDTDKFLKNTSKSIK